MPLMRRFTSSMEALSAGCDFNNSFTMPLLQLRLRCTGFTLHFLDDFSTGADNGTYEFFLYDQFFDAGGMRLVIGCRCSEMVLSISAQNM